MFNCIIIIARKSAVDRKPKNARQGSKHSPQVSYPSSTRAHPRNYFSSVAIIVFFPAGSSGA